jgi:hypothetical protein
MSSAVRHQAALALICLAGLTTARSGAALELYVSPGGDERWSGTLKEPNATRTDGPFASLQAARDELRRRRAASPLPGPVTVWLRAGTYALSETLAFDERDSGGPDAAVTYRAAPGEEVRITGGRDLPPASLEPVTEPALLARIISPEARAAVRQIDLRALGITDSGRMQARGFRRPYIPAPLELFIDAKPLWLARWPNAGTVAIGKVIDPGAIPRNGDVSERGGVFEYTDDRHTLWTQAEDLWLSGLWNYGYADDTIKVAAIDPAKWTVTLAQSTMYGVATGAAWRAYYALNLIEEIDQPGEYVVDRTRGVLYVYPPDGFLVLRPRVQVSLLEGPLLALEGTSHVAFEGIVFECSRGMGVYIERGTGNRLAGCTFRNLGMVGACIGKGTLPLKVYAHAGTAEPASRMLGSWHEHIYDNSTFNREGGTNHVIESCDFYNLGAGGISLGGGDRRTLTPAGNIVRNCHIHHFNRLDRTYKAAVNIDGVGNRIENCLIHDCPNNAIYLHGNDHVIEYNEVHHCCQVADDMGVLYLGRDPSEAGNIIRYNFFHHNGGEQGATGTLYFDDGASGVTVFGNVFFRNRGGMWNNGGYRHRFENNLFVETPAAINSGWPPANWHQQAGEELWQKRLRGDLDITRPPYAERYPELLQLYQAAPGDEALHGQEVRRNVAVRSGSFGSGRNRVEGNWETDDDPGFVDVIAMDFRLRPDAVLPTKVPGFQPIPFAKIGLYLDAQRRTLPVEAPGISARERFIGRTQVRIAAPRRAAGVVYTLDGTDPTAVSPRYQAPFAVERDTVIRARALADDKGEALGPAATLSLTRLQPREPTAAKINFAPAEVTVADWLNDYGAAFALQADGLAFGWSADNRGASRRRGLNPDPLLDTLVHFSDDMAWEMAVADGTYEVTVCIGDAQYACEDQALSIEGAEVVRGLNLAAGEFKRVAARVTVSDGGLTLTSVNAPHGPKLTRLAFLEFRRAE